MIYCQRCADDNGWPDFPHIPTLLNNCEMCGKLRTCFDVPTRLLSKPRVNYEEKDRDDIPWEVVRKL